MPFNGAGAYSLPAGSIVADGTTIDAADHNTPLQDIESSLSTVTLRNGATPFTGNQSFGNNKITSLAAGTVATDGATLAQAQSQVSNRATAIGGTANAVTLTFSPPFAAYTNGMRIRWRATATNTAAMTINVDGLGAKNFQMDASGTLAATFSGAVVSGMTIEAEYNSAADVFVWLNQKPVFLTSFGSISIPDNSNITPTSTTSGITIFGRSTGYPNGGGIVFRGNTGGAGGVTSDGLEFYAGGVEVARVDGGNKNLVMTGAGAIGYGTGSGGTVTQATSKGTGVTLNKTNGEIVMNNAALGAGVTVNFTLTCSAIAANDVVLVNIRQGAYTASNYRVQANPTTGNAIISLTNQSGGSLSDALVLNFAVIKAVNA